MPDDTITLAVILTAGGAVGTAALITGLIQLIKKLPGIEGLTAGQSRLSAFVLSAVAVVVAFVGTPVVATPATIFAAFLAWYGIARLSMAVYDDATAQTNSLRGPTA